MRTSWCDTCRGEAEGVGDLHKCSTCPRRFHFECEPTLRATSGNHKAWKCTFCQTESSPNDKPGKKSAKAVTSRVRALHQSIRAKSAHFYKLERKRLAPFVPEDRLHELSLGAGQEKCRKDPTLKRACRSQPFIAAELRPYQVTGVNWILDKYEMGVGGILGDEMGLGKTLQTIAFLRCLKESGLEGPHLVITPLAVLQNWHNEIKRFAPDMRAIKVHGSMQERDRILSMQDVLAGDYDIYLTTYEMIIAEEAFFTETFLFHTITVDEGHRLKNEASKLCASLARISAPFRLLLTGTPLQNNLYILPRALDGCRETFDEACRIQEGQLDRVVVRQARALLESMMLRRVKADVEKELKEKMHFVLKVPLSNLQRQWYKRFLEKKIEAQGVVSAAQLIARVMQLQKVINHPKCILVDLDRQREQARNLARRAEGSEFFQVPDCLREQSAASQRMEAELRGLEGQTLIASSGKLQLLDRLLSQVLSDGSRVLLFSQYTLTLDILSEYCAARLGPEGHGYLRLDGATNRIKREMDVRAFNAPGSRIPIYLISTRAGGQGINLATADVVVLYDTCWNPQVDLQAQDRAHRIGQTKQVKVYRLIADGTLEERILARARQKLVLDAMVIKKRGESSALASEVADDGSDEGMLSKLGLDELWGFLMEGADKVLDPTAQNLPPLTDADLDTIIERGRVNLEEDEKGEQASGGCGEEPQTDQASPTQMLLETPGQELPDSSAAQLSARPTPTAARDSPGDLRFVLNPEGTEVTSAEHPTSVNVVPLGRLSLALALELSQADSFRVASSMVQARLLRPFMSRQDCVDRVLGLTERGLQMLEHFGIHIPGGAGSSTEGARSDLASAGSQSLPSGSAGGRAGRERKPVKRFSPKMTKSSKATRPKLTHESLCFSCGDGGTLVECGFCPKVYHATVECAGVHKVPHGVWQCPWHACWECDRKSSQAGGVLFHCMSCPTTYCFDCCPDRYSMRQTKTQQHLNQAAMLERQGVGTKSWLFFSCDECEEFKRQESKRQKLAQAQAANDAHSLLRLV